MLSLRHWAMTIVVPSATRSLVLLIEPLGCNSGLSNVPFFGSCVIRCWIVVGLAGNLKECMPSYSTIPMFLYFLIISLKLFVIFGSVHIMSSLADYLYSFFGKPKLVLNNALFVVASAIVTVKGGICCLLLSLTYCFYNYIITLQTQFVSTPSPPWIHQQHKIQLLITCDLKYGLDKNILIVEILLFDIW